MGRKRKTNSKFFMEIESGQDGRKWKKTEKWKEFTH